MSKLCSIARLPVETRHFSQGILCAMLKLLQECLVMSYYRNVWTFTQILLFGARRYEKPLTDPGDLENFFWVAHIQTFP